MNATETALAKTPEESKIDAVSLLPDSVVEQAQLLAASGAFPDVKNVGMAVAKIQLGAALGLSAPIAMNAISFVQGKPFIGAEILAAKIAEHPQYSYRVARLNNDECVIEFFYGSGEARESLGESTYSMEDAKLAGLDKKDNYRKAPRNMLFARAISNGKRWFCPDVLGGATFYTNEERDLIRQEQAAEPEAEAVELIDDEQVKLLKQLIDDYCTTKERDDMVKVAFGDDLTKLTTEQAAELGIILEGFKREDAKAEKAEGDSE